MPLKIKCFLWFCWEGKLNTRDNLRKKLGKNFGGRVLCQKALETGDCLFSNCQFFSTIWKAICSSLGVLHPRSSFEHLCLDWRKRNFTKSSQHIVLNFDVTCRDGMGKLERGIPESSSTSHLPLVPLLQKAFTYLMIGQFFATISFSLNLEIFGRKSKVYKESFQKIE